MPRAKARGKLMDIDVIYIALINEAKEVLMPSSKIMEGIIGIGEGMKCFELG